MKVEIGGAQKLFRNLENLGNTLHMVEAAKAGCHFVKRVMIADFLSGQLVNIRTGGLIESWRVWDFDLPEPGAQLYSDLFYARIVNYRRRAGGGPPRDYLGAAVKAARPRLKQIALEAWRRSRAG
jgi:hypothetical protein